MHHIIQTRTLNSKLLSHVTHIHQSQHITGMTSLSLGLSEWLRRKFSPRSLQDTKVWSEDKHHHGRQNLCIKDLWKYIGKLCLYFHTETVWCEIITVGHNYLPFFGVCTQASLCFFLGMTYSVFWSLDNSNLCIEFCIYARKIYPIS